jgi:hypothetical protein
MPTQSEHLAKAQNNKKFASSLSPDTPTSIGWALTALFYSALHYVDAYNAKFNTRFTKHELRNKDIGRNPILMPIHDDYMDLCTFSYNARYEFVNFGTGHLQEAQSCHLAIETLIKPLL